MYTHHIDKIYVGIVNRCFSQIFNRVTTHDCFNIFFYPYLENEWTEYNQMFKFWRNSTIDFGVNCPSASEKSIYKLVSTLAPSFCKLVGSSLFLQVPRTTIYSRKSLKFGRIQPRAAELAALDQFINILLIIRELLKIF